ncbi:MAG TPA: YqeG family HAD IIIA-type phosphatase [Bacilli bacterium]|nr:YqeG family HAD IIIA-type phosphatase [Bacilli bacterium]
MKKFTPTYHAKSIYEVPLDFFKNEGILNILVDLDNTLASYKQHQADEKAKAFVESALNAGFNLIIVSNNRGERVKSYAASLGIEYRADMRKPLKFKFNRILNEKKFEKHETILIGDQLLTDVFVANRVGIKSMLVDKLVVEDQWTTRINRLLERPIRKRLIRKNQLKNWRDTYGKQR